ncbi:MAG: GNAT family N-acetyltransferase [Tuberibacillus sp.]
MDTSFLKYESPIALEFYKKEHASYLQEFYLPEEQTQFSSLPMEAVKRCESEPERHPIVILADGIPVGFFILHHGPALREYTENPNAILIRSLSVDYKHQGKGYAKKGMQMCPDFVREHFPFIDEIILVVNNRNITAQQLYKKVGFVDRGLRRIGPVGPQTIMHYALC